MRKAIILLPGISGSRIMAAERFKINRYIIKKGTLLWLDPSIGNILDGEFHSRLLALACNAQGRPIYPTTVVNKGKHEYGVLNTYYEPIEGLRRLYNKDYTVEFFPYDWRLPCQYNAGLLAERISKAGYEKVILIGHSMGGYVAMHYLLNQRMTQQRTSQKRIQRRVDIEKCIFAGTPFWGAPKTLYTLETGNFSGFILADKLLTGALKEICGSFPAVYELLPTKNYFEYRKNHYVNIIINDIKQEISTYGGTMDILKNRAWAKNKGMIEEMMAKQKEREFWEQKLLKDDRIHAICGIEIPTLKQIDMCYSNQGRFQNICGTKNGNGDGVVPIESASIGERIKNLYCIKSIDHMQLTASRQISKVINA